MTGPSSWARSLTRFPTWPVVGGIAILGLGSTVIASTLARTTSDKWMQDLWFEVAKAGVQIIAVGVLGGLLANAWKTRDAKKEERAKVREELVGLVTLYNDVKRVRRILKSNGLDLRARHRPDHPIEPGRPLTPQQAQVFHDQMLRLTDLQLEFESKVRQFGQTDLLGSETEKVVRVLGAVEHYLHDVLKVAWEQRGWTIHAGTEVVEVSDALQSLFRKDSFRAGMSNPLREITGLINAHVFSAASAETQRALEKVESHDAAAEDADEPPATEVGAAES